MAVNTLTFNDLITIAIIGLFTGFGSAMGNYLAQRSFIKHIEKLEIKKKEMK